MFPIPLIILILFSTGTAYLLSAATIKNRDLNHIIPFLINFGIWLTPVFYPVTVIPEKYTNLLFLNPMASIIQFFRWCVFNEPINIYILLGFGVAFLTFILGFFYFKSLEDEMIDIL